MSIFLEQDEQSLPEHLRIRVKDILEELEEGRKSQESSASIMNYLV